ncbi:MAG: pseudouridine synthase [Candidatus Dormibacteria bacterium]
MADGERLNRFLARSGVASRRAADQLIASGRVLVNGERPPPSGCLVHESDVVSVDGERIGRAGRLYVALNKPAGCITTMKDEMGRTTVADLLAAELVGGTGIFPVGRLDRETRGLLLFTNDGDLGHALTHPRHGIEKEYAAVVSPAPTEAHCRQLLAGVTLTDGAARATACEIVERATPGRGTLAVTVTLGRNRVVRRMLDHLGLEVLDLARTRVGPVRLGRLREGGHRGLTPDEVALLLAAGRAPGP